METRVLASAGVRTRRRRFLMPGPQQRGAVLRVTGLSALLLGVFDLTYLGMLRASSEHLAEIAPDLSGIIRGQDADQMVLVLLGSAITLGGIVLLTILETHRTAGPLHNLVRRLEEMARGDRGVRLRFRREDRFRELEEAFNRMAEAAEVREQMRAAEVERLAMRIREASRLLALPGTDRAAVAADLQGASAELQRLAEER